MHPVDLGVQREVLRHTVCGCVGEWVSVCVCVCVCVCVFVHEQVCAVKKLRVREQKVEQYFDGKTCKFQ